MMFGLAALAVAIVIIFTYDDKPHRPKLGPGVGTSRLVYDGDYNVELFLGNEQTEQANGFFTIDSGSSKIIVNGKRCKKDLCTKSASGRRLKQFTPPALSEMKYPYQFEVYGDNSGYAYNVYSMNVTIPGGKTIPGVEVGYNFHAVPNVNQKPFNATDNFKANPQGPGAQGIFGLAFDCQAEVKEPNCPRGVPPCPIKSWNGHVAKVFNWNNFTEYLKPSIHELKAKSNAYETTKNKVEHWLHHQNSSQPVFKTVTKSIVDSGLSKFDSFTACLNGTSNIRSNAAGSVTWGSGLPDGMPAADVDAKCGMWSLTFESFELTTPDGKSAQKFTAAPLVVLNNRVGKQCSRLGVAITSKCGGAPYVDTGDSHWTLNEADFESLYSMMAAFYAKVDPTLATLLRNYLNHVKEHKTNPTSITQYLKKELGKSELGKKLQDNPVNVKVNFKGTRAPSMTKQLTVDLLEQLKVTQPFPRNHVTLGQPIINGHVLHFDKTNLESPRLGMETVASFTRRFGGGCGGG